MLLVGACRLFQSIPNDGKERQPLRAASVPLPAGLEHVYTCQHGENKNRAAQFYGDLVGLGMALHHWVSAPDFLEGRARDFIVAVLSWDVVQLAGALIRIAHFMNGIMAPDWQGSLPPAHTSRLRGDGLPRRPRCGA